MTWYIKKILSVEQFCDPFLHGTDKECCLYVTTLIENDEGEIKEIENNLGCYNYKNAEFFEKLENEINITEMADGNLLLTELNWKHKHPEYRGVPYDRIQLKRIVLNAIETADALRRGRNISGLEKHLH